MAVHSGGSVRDPVAEPSRLLKPFLINENFRRVYCDLVDAVHGGEPLAMLIGEAGIGKTTLLEHLLHGLPFDGVAAERFTFPGRSRGAEDEADAVWTRVRARLELLVGDGQPVVLAVDDAERVPQDVLAEILAQPKPPGDAPGRLSVLLAGTPSLTARISTASACRVAELKPLKRADVTAYLAQVLDTVDAPLFPGPAVDALAQQSRGNLGRINRIGGIALTLAGAGGATAVTAQLVAEAAGICDTLAASADPVPTLLGPRSKAATEQTLLCVPPHALEHEARADAKPGTAAQAPEDAAERLEESAAAWSTSDTEPKGLHWSGQAGRRSQGQSSRLLFGYAATVGFLLSTVAFGWKLAEPSLRVELFSFDLRERIHRLVAAADSVLTSPPLGPRMLQVANSITAEAEAAAPAAAPMPDAIGAAAAKPSPVSPEPELGPAPASHSATTADSEELVAALLARGDEMLRLSDVVAARLCYQRAANAGSARALAAMAATYDPAALAAGGIHGVHADPPRANLLYAEAAHAGDPVAEKRLQILASQVNETGNASESQTAELLSRQQ